MRKTLLQTLLAAFCAILCGTSALGGGGMMIGARVGAWAKSGGGGWVNPYVTDGLVACWDIGNAKVGDTIWKDAVGARDFTIQNGAYIGEEYAYCPTKVTGFVADTTFGREEVKTLEMIFAVVSGFWRATIHPVLFSDGGYKGISSFDAWFTATDDSFSSINITRNMIDILNDGSARSYCVVYSGENSGTANYAYLNNSRRNPDGAWGGAKPTSDGTCRIYGTFGNMALYSIRCYNKILSDSERTENWNVDKARFNLT